MQILAVFLLAGVLVWKSFDSLVLQAKFEGLVLFFSLRVCLTLL